MSTRILIIGGYGNFGRLIARRISREPGITLIIAGRSEHKAREVAGTLQAQWLTIEVPHTLEAGFASVRPHIVIHTSGPFQTQSYDVAEACIRHQCHYVDLADGRHFVTNIVRLNELAKAAGINVISGASTVPALTSAIVDQYRNEFMTLESIEYGIATAQKPNLGLATTRSVLSYAGKPFQTLIGGEMKQVFGWQNLRWRKFRELGWRALGNCDVPDLDLFPRRYPELKTIRFQAGLELPLIHLSLWALTGFVRMGALSNLAAAAPTFLSLSRLFDVAGTDVSGFYMELKGYDYAGLFMPTACVGLLELGAILNELRSLDIEESVTETTAERDSHKQNVRADHSQ